MKLHAALAAAARAQGAEALFGLMGDGNLFFANSFERDHGGRFVSVAHEATAVLAALGYARVTGRVGFATVTHGPAFTNTVTALIEGARARLPMVLIAGDTALGDERNLQRVPQRAVAELAEAAFVDVRGPATWRSDFDRAYRTARAQSRPVVLNVRVDLMWADVEAASADGPVALSASSPATPRDEDLDIALGMITASRRPLVLAGRGAVHARQVLLQLADQLGAPVATTIGAAGLFDGQPGDIGLFGGLASDRAVQAIAASDCIIAFGASLNQFTTAHDALLQDKAVVICDDDPSRARSDVRGSCLVGGDAGAVANAMLALLEEAELPPSRFRSSVEAQAPEPPTALDEDAPVEAEVAYRLMAELLPDDHLLVTDAGRFLPLAWRALRVDEPSKLVPTTHFGSIGLGMGYAIGASVARPALPVTLVTGDGGHMLGGFTELTTAIRHALPLTVVVMNDGGYGAEWVQFEARGMDTSPALLDWPDLAAVARAAGAEGWSVTTLAELRVALASSAPGPKLIDVRLDPAAVPNALH